MAVYLAGNFERMSSSSWKKHSLVKYGEIQRKRRRKRSRRGNRGQGGGGDENVEKEDMLSLLRTSLTSTIEKQIKEVRSTQRQEEKRKRRESMEEDLKKKKTKREENEEEVTVAADPFPETAFSKYPEGLDKKRLEELRDEDYTPKTVRIKQSGGGEDETLKCRSTISSNMTLTPSAKHLIDGTYGIREKLLKQWGKNTKLSEMQRLILPAMMSYQDVVFLNRSDDKDARDVRRLYALHCLNHIMRSRARVRKHDAEIKGNREEKKESHRDQGYCRPRILVLLPFRSDCEMFVNDLLSLIPERYKIHNKRRFQDEFGDPPSSSSEDEDEQGSKEVPEWRRVFSGNNDDCFRIGLQISTSSLRLFTDFYHSDIIVCSPLGLRLVTATQDERELTKKGDTDFLSSIEIFIADRAGVLEMQNWENVVLALENSNRVPKKNIEVDLNRIYDWVLNEQGSYYRQNLMFSSFCTWCVRAWCYCTLKNK